MAHAKRLMIIGAHPDDCEFMGGGTAALCRQAGWDVRFVAVTSGNAGHQNMKPKPLAARRLKEGTKAASRIGASFQTLGEPDGRLYVTEKSTSKVIKAIRSYQPNVVICHRICDYHRDHRYAAQLVLDASYILKVPLVCPDVPALERVPVILYACDSFTEGPQFRAHLLIDTTKVVNKCVEMLMEHKSQFLEWLPWVGGRHEGSLKRHVTNKGAVARDIAGRWHRVAERFATELRKKYGHRVQGAEAFQVSEYGDRISPANLKKLLPF